MGEKEYLSEERYKKNSKKVSIAALIILIIGLSIGGYLIYSGITKPGTSKIEELKVELENKRIELENKGVKYKSNAKFTDGEVYDLYVITKALDPSFDWCSFDECKNNDLTREYCTLKNRNSEAASVLKIMFGAFISIATCMIAGNVFATAKGREITAYYTQQQMPVAKEGIEKVAPSVGKAAKEVAKGIKDGLKDEDE